MTVIAGANLFSGVILVADCRATIKRRGRRDIHCDIAQKLIPIAPCTVVGFSGSVHAGDQLLRTALAQLRHRSRTDAVSIRQWLPRFFRSSYRRYARRHGAQQISFLVGSVIQGRANLVERAKVASLLKAILTSPIKRSFVPDIVMRIMMMPPERIFVPVGECAGLLYSLSAPDFRPRHYAPLEYCAIGSGHGTTVEIARTADWLLAGQPGVDMVEAMALTEAVSEFAAAEGIEDVGGMFPCVKLDRRGIIGIGHSTGLKPNRDRVSLRFDSAMGRWVQRNEATGKEIRLLLPWEIDASAVTADMRFDDWHEAVRRFNPRRLQKKNAGT